jgi:diguanylate cyclase (GGDEF)-like protein
MGAGQDPAALRAQLTEAVASSQRAYRDSSRLITLLAVIGEPAPSCVLVRRTLAALAEVFSADAVYLAYPDSHPHGDRLHIEAATGFADDEEPALPDVPELADGVFRGQAAAWVRPPGQSPGQSPGLSPPRRPPAAGRPVPGAAVVVPMSGSDPAAGSLVLVRHETRAFEAAELPLLLSMAGRLHASLEEAGRREAIEHLARTAHRLTRHVDQAPLFGDALALLGEMTGAERSIAVAVDGGQAVKITSLGMPDDYAAAWPIPVEKLTVWPAARRGEPYMAADLHAGDGSRVIPLEWRQLRAVLCVPVVLDGEPVALLLVFHARPGYFTRTSADSATALAGWLASALANARLLSALSEREGELRQLTGELERRATHDSLTGLANRELARELLQRSLATQRDDQVGLLFCDLDKFKSVNDRLGHEAGDDLLRQVAGRLAASVRGRDLLARLGGDEFLVVLPAVADLDEVTGVGARVLAALAEPFDLAGEQVYVTASVGGVIGERGPAGATAVELLRDADAAMYAAKNRGRGRVEVFDRFTAQNAVQRLALREQLQRAAERNELELDYQPIVALEDRRIIGFEALLRWNHPQLGRVSPIDFVPMAEETGAIVAIGWWALREACRRLADWQGRFSDSLTMAVNVSALQLLDPDFPERSIEIIRSAGLRLRDVWIEITESVPVTDELIGRLGRLRDAGVRIAMDDFGTSYSNLGYLKRMPVERLKIDREFVRGLGAAEGVGLEERIDRGIVRAVVAIAESAGMSVVAEGIETEEQRQVLLDLGCDRGQGYLFAPPRSASVVAAALQSSTGLSLTG